MIKKRDVINWLDIRGYSYNIKERPWGKFLELEGIHYYFLTWSSMLGFLQNNYEID